MNQSRVTFPCGSLKLEGIFCSAGTDHALASVIICHPHSLYGGSMENNVTLAISDGLLKSKMNTFLFNFRGVGASEGNYGGGLEERKDVLAALDWLLIQPGVDEGKIGLAGYSFGAGVAFPVACSDDRVKAIAMISPYFEVPQDSLLKSCKKPKLFVEGTEDRMVRPEDVGDYVTTSAEPKKGIFISGADHFWGGYEREAANEVAQFFRELFAS